MWPLTVPHCVQLALVHKKKRKILRECCKYLTENRLDRTQFWRRVGDNLVCDVGALEHADGRRVLGSNHLRERSVIGCCKCGAAHPLQDKRGGGPRWLGGYAKESTGIVSRDDCILSCALARTLNPLQGGSAPRNAERPIKLQLLQPFAVDRFEEGNLIRSKKDQAIYVGISNPTGRFAETDAEELKWKSEINDEKGQADC